MKRSNDNNVRRRRVTERGFIVMKKLITASVAVALALAFGSGAANAASLSTPALQSDGVHRLVCVVSNVGSKPITVLSADIIGDLSGTAFGGGFTVGSLPECTQVELQPGTGCSSPLSSNAFNPRIGHCVVTFKGSKKSVRAALWVVDGTFPHNLVGPVAPAN